MKFVKRFFYAAIAIITAFLAAGFSVQNKHEVIFKYYLGTAHWPLSLLIALAFAFGVTLTCIAVSIMIMRLKLNLANNKRSYRNLELKYQAQLEKSRKAQMKIER